MLGNILVTDDQGVAIFANVGIARRTGYSVAQIIGSKPGKLWGGRMPRRYYETMWQTIRQRPFSGVVTNQHRDGQIYQEPLAIAPVQGIDGSKKYVAFRSPIAKEEAFLSEWQKVFHPKQVTAASVLPWLRRWFPGETFSDADASETFSTWIDSNWAKPLRDRFSARSDDRVLILAAQQDPKKFQVLYEKYYPTVRSYFSRHLLGQEDLTADLAQDTLLRAFERLDGYEIRNAAYGTYLLRIAHSILLNTYREKMMFELSPDLAAKDRADSVELHWIWETPELSFRERRVLSAYYREGFSIREISQGLETSENAVKLLLSRARKKLRPLLSSV
ncbi:MAG: sigma-70 family RNA polymerase sigma factor [Undibacterium sp.]